MRYALGLVLLLMMSGCSQSDQQSIDVSDGATTDPSQVARVADTATGAVDLPSGLQFTMSSHVRSDEIKKTSSGTMRRRVVYELLDVGPADVYDVVAADFERVGYKPSKKKERKSGGFTVAFRKKGAESVNVLFYPGLSGEPSNPGAKSMIAVGWNVGKPGR